jgi:hypothetical protein
MYDMKNRNLIIIAIIAAFTFLNSCKDSFLEVAPKGSLAETTLASPDGVEALLIGAYSMLDGISDQGTGGWEAAGSNWVYGSIRGLEANKGTDSGDQPDINPIQTFSETATNPYLNLKWRSVYEAISRCNSVIRVAANALADGTLDQAAHDLAVKQARVLRGWYHFEAWRMWAGMIPYVDENTDPGTVTNTADVRAQIIADLTEGTTLPQNMGQIGRFNQTVSQVILAKAQMQMNGDYAAALTQLNSARNGTKPDGSAIGLADTYGEIFEIENRNGIEAVYTVQYSVNDGSGGWNGGWGEVLNFPYKGGGSPGGCCGFFQPTQEFVNSFRTSGGLPLLDFSYNNNPVTNDQGLAISDPFTPDSGPFDPRLDWTVGRRGIPYWDWGPHTGTDWIRDQTYAGPFSPKKQVYKKSDEGATTEVGNWTSGYTANGYRLIRYADVLLMIAECQIETGDLAGANANINLVRNRAANPAGFVMLDDGSAPASTYEISPYPAFTDATQARDALRMERKLELGMEGHRYFDLNRWGIAVAELNRALTYEKTQPWGGALYGSATVGSEDTSFPIPLRQIELSNENLTQTPGH